MAECSIGLGGNLGHTAKRFDEALSRLSDSGVHICRVSRTLETPAMGESAGGDFLNAVAVLETTRTPAELLTLLHAIETQLGRQRTTHWGPRVVDLDLLLYADQMIDSENLVVPHPGLWYRRFVLQPHAEIAGDWFHPVLGETVQGLYERLQQKPLILDIITPQETPLSLHRLESSLSSRFHSQTFRLRSASVNEPRSEDRFAGFEITPLHARGRGRTQPRPRVDRTFNVMSDPAIETEGQVLTALTNVLTAALAATDARA